MAGGEELLGKLQEYASDDVRFVAAPCIGACDKAPAAAVGNQLVEHAKLANVVKMLVIPMVQVVDTAVSIVRYACALSSVGAMGLPTSLECALTLSLRPVLGQLSPMVKN